jgi:hypothetical protein
MMGAASMLCFSVVVGLWAVRQLSRPTPVGAVAPPFRWRLLLVVIGVLLFLLLVIAVGVFGLAYYLHEM